MKFIQLKRVIRIRRGEKYHIKIPILDHNTWPFFLSFGGHNKLGEVPKGKNHQAPTDFSWSQRIPNRPISNQIIEPMKNVLVELY